MTAAEAKQDPQPQAKPHPLDPLSAAELAASVDILKKGRQLGDAFRFVSCVLAEPDKQTVLAEKPAEAISRQAFLVLLDNASGTGYEAVVDLTAKRVVRFEALPKANSAGDHARRVRRVRGGREAQPRISGGAGQSRGVTDSGLVMVEPWSAGNYGTEAAEDRGRRLLRALCFVRSEPTDNGFARPLQGVVAVVDLNR